MSRLAMRDEAEDPQYRCTYIGSMPGKIVQNMAKAAVHNPLFLLDEVDKMSMDLRGDPSSAAVRGVLDPEQNDLNDHHRGRPGPKWRRCTANSLNILPLLLDRMEVIRLLGYTEDEKMNTVRRYLVPKQMKSTWAGARRAQGLRTALLDDVRFYTREVVRNLEREIAGDRLQHQQMLHKKETCSVARCATSTSSACAAPLRQGRGPGSRRKPGHRARLDGGGG